MGTISKEGINRILSAAQERGFLRDYDGELALSLQDLTCLSSDGRKVGKSVHPSPDMVCQHGLNRMLGLEGIHLLPQQCNAVVQDRHLLDPVVAKFQVMKSGDPYPVIPAGIAGIQAPGMAKAARVESLSRTSMSL